MSASIFAAVEMAPRDPILGLTEAFNADPRTDKVNLGVGVYYDDNGKLPLLNAVRIAEEARLSTQPPRGYQPIDGNALYNQGVRDLLFGADSQRATDGTVFTLQALGGTGALKVGADYLRKLLPQTTVYISDPSWENHRALFEAAGFPVEVYPYFDSARHGVDFDAMKQKLSSLSPLSVVLLHACCHNPTGADLTKEQWKEVVAICEEKNLVPLLDMAYQGFAETIEGDADAVRIFADSGVQFLVASSFSKNFSLYGERVGALSIVTASPEEAARVSSQVKRVVRTNYSNPPTHGAAIVAAVLGSAELQTKWRWELYNMRDRIHDMRFGLVKALEAERVEGFRFIAQQRGMFSYTGLNKEQVELLKTQFGIYAVSSGRINIAALNSRNLPYVAKAIAAVA